MAGPCDTCHAGCCRSYHLFITAFDAFRVARDLGVTVGEFATMTVFDAADAVRYEEEYTALRFTDQPEDKRFFLALRRIDSALFPGTHKCYFLQEWRRENEAPERGEHPGRHTLGRCGIYSSRPMVCRTYPTSLHPTVPVGLINTPPPPQMPESQEAHTLCPEEWTAANFGVEPTRVIHNLAIRRFEREFYNQAVAEFNAENHPLPEYFPFMLRVYEHRFRDAPKPHAAKSSP